MTRVQYGRNDGNFWIVRKYHVEAIQLYIPEIKKTWSFFLLFGASFILLTYSEVKILKKNRTTFCKGHGAMLYMEYLENQIFSSKIHNLGGNRYYWATKVASSVQWELKTVSCYFVLWFDHFHCHTLILPHPPWLIGSTKGSCGYSEFGL